MKNLKTRARAYAKDPDTAIRFYEFLAGTKAMSRFGMPEAGLGPAIVSDVLVICGTDEALHLLWEKDATFRFDLPEEFHRFLVARGATVLRPPQPFPTGITRLVRHSDSSVFEYVEHQKPRPA